MFPPKMNLQLIN